MHAAVTLTQSELPEFLLHVAVVRPVFIWGQPGIGKSALVREFADSVGLECVSMLGSQLAPEDLIGVPQILDGKSRFCPPTMIARDEAYCLFLDELNASSHEVQKAFYSLIHERRLGEYHLAEGSVIIGAGNRVQDSAIVKPMSSALLNRMLHVHLDASYRDWLTWAEGWGIHPLVLDYVRTRPDHLRVAPPKTEEPFSTPRSWHMLSDALWSYDPKAAGSPDALSEGVVKALAYSCLTPSHAQNFCSLYKQHRRRFDVNALIKGDARWPRDPEDADLLYFLAQSFRGQLMKTLPAERAQQSSDTKILAHDAKRCLADLAGINLEIAQLVVAEDEQGEALPGWFLTEVYRDLPRLVRRERQPG